jgi:hypothetical protein
MVAAREESRSALTARDPALTRPTGRRRQPPFRTHGGRTHSAQRSRSDRSTARQQRIQTVRPRACAASESRCPADRLTSDLISGIFISSFSGKTKAADKWCTTHSRMFVKRCKPSAVENRRSVSQRRMRSHHSGTSCSPRPIWCQCGPTLKEQRVEQPFFPFTRSFLSPHAMTASCMNYSHCSTRCE